MADASRDGNFVTTLLGVSSTDGFTPVKVYADPVTHRLLIDTAGGSGTVSSITAGTGLTATPTNPITTTGTILLNSKLAPLDTLGSAGQLIRVNAGATALEYFTTSAGGVASVVGTANRITVNSTDPANPVVDIAATYVGQSSITTLGTIATGTWAGTTIAVNHGGTGGTSASITLFNNITGYTAAGATGTTSTNLVFSTSPTLVTPVLGAATATSINKMAITAPASASTLAVADGKTATISNTLTFTGTDGSSVAFGTGGTVLYSASTIPLTVGSTTIASGTSTRILYDNAGVLGEYTITGTGTVVAMQAAPTFTTSITTPKVIGGSGTTGTQLTLQTTTGNGTTDALIITGGNNGGTTFATFTTGALTLGTSGVFTTGTIELGNASDTTLSRSSAGVLAVEGNIIPTLTSSSLLSNKRIFRRLTTVSGPGATPTTNTDNVDVQNFTALATAITSMTTNLSGTPNDGDLVEFRFTDNGTARGITWGASFGATTVALPTTTVISTMLRALFEWNAAASLWQCVAVA